MDNTHRRTKRFIDPEVQGALAKRMALHWLAYALVVGALLVSLRWLVNPGLPLTEHIADAWAIYAPVFVIMASIAPMFIYDAVKLSNRFTGPVMRLRRGLKELAQGEQAEPIKLRDNDFWQDVARDFNAVNDRISRS